MDKKLKDDRALTLIYLYAGCKKVNMIRLLGLQIPGPLLEYRFSTKDMSPMSIYEYCKYSKLQAMYFDGHIYETKALTEDEYRH